MAPFPSSSSPSIISPAPLHHNHPPPPLVLSGGQCHPQSFEDLRASTRRPKCPRLQIGHARMASPNRLFVRVAAAVSKQDGSFPSSFKEATFDLKFPRRNLIVRFTCDACGERTQRTINRLAYERGTVFLQCAGCEQYHKFVDNLGLIVEYDFREETAAGNTNSE